MTTRKRLTAVIVSLTVLIPTSRAQCPIECSGTCLGVPFGRVGCNLRDAIGGRTTFFCPSWTNIVLPGGFVIGQIYWNIKNSWGTSWGDGGNMRIARGLGHCGIGGLYTVPICAATTF